MYHKASDGKTKNDHFADLLAAAHARGFRPRAVLFDGWYASVDNLKRVRTFGWVFVTRLKGNRKVRIDHGRRAVADQPIGTSTARASRHAPAWSAGSRHVYYTAKVKGIELMRVALDGTATQLTTSKPGTRHFHPAVSPDGKWILFGSDRGGTMQLYVADADGREAYPITAVPAGSCAMHGHWQPAKAEVKR